MTTKTVAVTIFVDVTVDETKFTEAFLAEFRESFYKFGDIDAHMQHLAQLTAREIYEPGEYNREVFIEGYGPASGMGILTKVTGMEMEIQP